MMKPMTIGVWAPAPLVMYAQFLWNDGNTFLQYKKHYKKICESIQFVSVIRLSHADHFLTTVLLHHDTVANSHRTNRLVFNWGQSLNGIIIVPQYDSTFHFVFETRGAIAPSVQRVGEVPVCVLAGPDEIYPDGLSNMCISVRSDRYRFERGDGSVSHMFRALEWIAEINASMGV
jgi:hypothetical protein